MKGFRASGEAFSPIKRTFSTSKHEIASLFYFLRVIFAFLNSDPDSQSGSNPQTQFESIPMQNTEPDPDNRKAQTDLFFFVMR
jgi:hypothetical protein